MHALKAALDFFEICNQQAGRGLKSEAIEAVQDIKKGDLVF